MIRNRGHAQQMELPFLPWTGEYAIGHAALDAEHRRLVEVINEVCAFENTGCAPEQLKPLLEALTVATVAHFKNENTVMREISGWASRLDAEHRAAVDMMSAAAVNEHCAEHAKALLELESIIHAFYFGADSDRETLGKTLIDWFLEHALEQDLDLRDLLKVYFSQSQAAAARNGP